MRLHTFNLSLITTKSVAACDIINTVPDKEQFSKSNSNLNIMSKLAPTTTRIARTLNREDFIGYFYDPTCMTGLKRVDENGIPCMVGTPYYRTGKKKQAINISIRGTNYQVHRIIWALVYGSIGDQEMIDHIDGNPFNNRIENLRIATPAINSRNAVRRSNNTTGYTGVNPYTRNDSDSYGFQASWMENGKIKTKQFSSRKYGVTNAFNMAVEHRKQMIQMLNEQGHGYTERHGK